MPEYSRRWRAAEGALGGRLDPCARKDRVQHSYAPRGGQQRLRGHGVREVASIAEREYGHEQRNREPDAHRHFPAIENAPRSMTLRDGCERPNRTNMPRLKQYSGRSLVLGTLPFSVPGWSF
jgi:hypothetical protein